MVRRPQAPLARSRSSTPHFLSLLNWGLKSPTVSDVPEAAAAALGIPTALARRSAAARAAVSGVAAEEVLASWAGGAPVAAAPAAAPEAAAPEAPAAEPAATDTAPAREPELAVAPPAFPAMEAVPAAVAVMAEPATELEPVALGTRVKTATRVGSWVGASLGVVGFLVATMSWAPAAIIPEEGAAVAIEVSPATALIAIAAVSVVFGAIVASISRAATTWRDPAMGLTGKRTTTAWIGAGIGLILGVIAGALLTGAFATPVGEEGLLVHLPVLATLVVMLVGGAILGAMTAAVPQLFGTPVAVDEGDRDETVTMRGRLGATVGVPLAGLLLLALLVLPFAYILIQSNHLTSNGAALVAIIAAGGILGFAALSGNRPNVRITMGELMVAVVGIGTILLIVLAVLVFRDNGSHEEDETPESAAIVWVA